MLTPLRVLILEDNPYDAEIEIALLERRTTPVNGNASNPKVISWHAWMRLTMMLSLQIITFLILTD